MRIFTTELQQALGREVSTLATCWILTRKDSNKTGFTDHVENIKVDDFIYHSGSNLSPSSVENLISTNSSNFEVSGILDSELLLKTEILSGLYDNSYMEMFILDYTNPKLGKVLIKSGYLGEVRLSGDNFIVEVYNIADKLNSNIAKLYSPDCRADFCDLECKFTNPTFVQGNVTSATNNTIIIYDSMDMREPLYSFGKMKFVTGSNKDEIREVLECKGNTVILKKAFQKLISIGDEFVLYKGCDKKFNTCSKVYNNAVNFRGEPHLVQMEEIQYESR